MLGDRRLHREPVLLDSNGSSPESGFKAGGGNVSTEVPCFPLKSSSSVPLPSPRPLHSNRHSLALLHPLSWVVPTKKRATATSLSNLRDLYTLGEREGPGWGRRARRTHAEGISSQLFSKPRRSVFRPLAWSSHLQPPRDLCRQALK